MYIWLELKEALYTVFDLPYLYTIWICYRNVSHTNQTPEFSRIWSEKTAMERLVRMQYIDMNIVMKVINNEITHEYSTHGHLKMLEKKVTRSFQSCVEMLSNWFDFCPVGCVFDKFLLLWIAFQKDFALLLELNSKNTKIFLVSAYVVSWIKPGGRNR